MSTADKFPKIEYYIDPAIVRLAAKRYDPLTSCAAKIAARDPSALPRSPTVGALRAKYAGSTLLNAALCDINVRPSSVATKPGRSRSFTDVKQRGWRLIFGRMAAGERQGAASLGRLSSEFR